MNLVRRSNFVIEIQDRQPVMTEEMCNWCEENDITYEEERTQYGTGRCHYHLHITFACYADMSKFETEFGTPP